MNYKQISIAGTMMLFSAGVLLNLTSLAADALPKGWLKAGDRPQDYEMSVDTAVKHGGKPVLTLSLSVIKQKALEP